jgi:putative aldouronate transport system substrate-binding protein
MLFQEESIMKRRSALALAAFIAVGTLAFGQAVKVSAPGVYPIVDKQITMKAMVPQRLASTPDWATNKATLLMEKVTGVKIQFEVAPDFNQALSLSIASGDLPDIYFGSSILSADIMRYGPRGLFIPLNPLIEKQGVYIKKMFASEPWIKDVQTAPDGNIYGLPQMNDDLHGVYGQKVWINKPWLDKLGLKVPTTTEEFYTVLKAFKTRDPNGNGIADEIPYTASTTSYHGQIPGAVLNAFLPVNTFTRGMYLDKGTVKLAYVEDTYKEGLKYHVRLYKEGLIDPAAFTQTVEQLRQVAENSKDTIVGVGGGSWWDGFSMNGGKSGRYKDYVLVPPLKGPAGVQSSGFYKYKISKDLFVITKASKIPEVAIKWVDYLFSDEGAWNCMYGPQDIGWKKPAPGSIAISGKPAMFERLLSQETTNFNWSVNIPMYQPVALRTAERRAEGEDVWLAAKLMTRLVGEVQAKYVGIQPPDASIMPPVYLNERQTAEIKLVETSIVNLINESATRFITGDLDIDKEWNNYLANLKKAGMDKWLALYQEAYNDQFKKK